MYWYIAFLPTLMIVFGASFLWNIFRDFMSHSIDDANDEVSQVEVINIHDFRSR